MGIFDQASKIKHLPPEQAKTNKVYHRSLFGALARCCYLSNTNNMRYICDNMRGIYYIWTKEHFVEWIFCRKEFNWFEKHMTFNRKDFWIGIFKIILQSDTLSLMHSDSYVFYIFSNHFSFSYWICNSDKSRQAYLKYKQVNFCQLSRLVSPH